MEIYSLSYDVVELELLYYLTDDLDYCLGILPYDDYYDVNLNGLVSLARYQNYYHYCHV